MMLHAKKIHVGAFKERIDTRRERRLYYISRRNALLI